MRFIRYSQVSLLLSLGIAVLTPRLAMAQPLFHAASIGYDVALFPTDVAIADLDRDGQLDMAVCNISTSITLWFGGGQGQFARRQDVPAGQFPSSIVIADFNEDSCPDIALADQDPGGMLVGHGDGTFDAPRSLGAGIVTVSIASADLNRDGHADLLLGDWYRNQIVALLGRGDGTFQNGITFAAGSSPRSVEVGDLNRDGIPDAVVAGFFNDEVSEWYGVGDGSFLPGPVVHVRGRPNASALGDFNGDSWIDIAAASSEGTIVTIILGSPGGPAATREVEVGASPFGIVTDDFTRDRFADIVVSLADGDIILLSGDGAGAFGEPTHFVGGFFGWGLARADLNSDGWLDLAVTGHDHFVSTLFGRAGGFADHTLIRVGGAPGGIAAGDLNEDGRPDLVCGIERPSHLVLLAQQADGSYSVEQELSSGFPLSVEVADLDEDAHLDIIVAGFPGLTVLRGRGAGHFDARVDYQLQEAVRSMRIHDLNHDGMQDAVVLLFGGDSLAVLLGKPGATFDAPTYYDLGSGTSGIAVADFNEDGFLDVAAAGTLMEILLGDGTGSLRSAGQWAIPDGATSLAAGDLNGDGHADLVTGGAYPFDARTQRAGAISLGRGDGAFESTVQFGQAFYGKDIEMADVNADGRQDVLMVGTAFSIALFPGRGDGTVEEARYYGSGRFPQALVVKDMNADGRADLAVTNGGDQSVSVLINQGPFPETLPTRAYLPGANRTVPVGHAGPDLCVRLEPVGRAFAIAEVDLATISMVSPGTGSVDRIGALVSKRVTFGDFDGNGVGEIQVCFGAADLAALFREVRGRSQVQVTLQGSLITGAHFQGELALMILSSGKPSLQVSLLPNPLTEWRSCTPATLRRDGQAGAHARRGSGGLSGRISSPDFTSFRRQVEISLRRVLLSAGDLRGVGKWAHPDHPLAKDACSRVAL